MGAWPRGEPGQAAGWGAGASRPGPLEEEDETAAAEVRPWPGAGGPRAGLYGKAWWGESTFQHGGGSDCPPPTHEDEDGDGANPPPPIGFRSHPALATEGRSSRRSGSSAPACAGSRPPTSGQPLWHPSLNMLG